MKNFFICLLITFSSVAHAKDVTLQADYDVLESKFVRITGLEKVFKPENCELIFMNAVTFNFGMEINLTLKDLTIQNYADADISNHPWVFGFQYKCGNRIKSWASSTKDLSDLENILDVENIFDAEPKQKNTPTFEFI